MNRCAPVQRPVIRSSDAAPTGGTDFRAGAPVIAAVLLMLLAVSLAGAAHAQTEPASVSAPTAAPSAAPSAASMPAAHAVGDTTRGLLALQRGGTQASATARRIDAPVAALGYQRYLDSFRHPIPESAATRNGDTGRNAGAASPAGTAR